MLSILNINEKLLVSDLLGVFIATYVILLLFVVFSFIDIYSIDKLEFLYNKQKCLVFKRRIPFIIMYSKTKTAISKKTLIYELIGYVIGIYVIANMVISLFLTLTVVFIILLICVIVTLIYFGVMRYFYHKIKKSYRNIRA
ncbi:MAG: hypothetical protein K2O22_04545 [Anaeroplasmataceae bacterium]|nr:hypothetical protein [Anaeroplasmataceae bacterium]